MTEIEQLRKDIATLEAAEGIIGNMCNENNTTAHMQRILKMQRQKLSRLEAEAADPWRRVKEQVKHLSGDGRFDIYNYANNLGHRIAELEAELAKRPVTWVAKKSTGSLFMGYDEPMIFASKKQAAHLMNCLNLMPQVFDVEPYTGQQK